VNPIHAGAPHVLTPLSAAAKAINGSGSTALPQAVQYTMKIKSTRLSRADQCQGSAQGCGLAWWRLRSNRTSFDFALFIGLL